MRPARRRIALMGIGLAATLAAVGTAGSARNTWSCGDPLPRGSQRVSLDPRDFTTRITHPYWPMRPGDRWTYRETADGEPPQTVVVTVTSRTKLLANGVRARVVRDLVTQAGVPVEATDDWYAQDRCGNVWYLGEATTEYEDGRPVSTHGSFEAGRDGAQAGILLPARPRPGLTYRQEFLAGEAEDAARVLSVDEQAEVRAGHFRNVLLTKDFTPLEPRVLEYKLYARGVGPVLALSVSGGPGGREELVRHRSGG